MHFAANELSELLFVVFDVVKELMNMGLKVLEAVPPSDASDVFLHEVPKRSIKFRFGE